MMTNNSPQPSPDRAGQATGGQGAVAAAELLTRVELRRQPLIRIQNAEYAEYAEKILKQETEF